MTSTLLDPIVAEDPIASPVDQPIDGGTVLTVGVGKEFATISEAIAAAHNGDVIAVDAGTYIDSSNAADRNIITENLTIEGVGGMVHLEMGPQGLANGKGLFDVESGSLTLKNFELSGASDQGTGGIIGSEDGNVAGIRVDATSTTTRTASSTRRRPAATPRSRSTTPSLPTTARAMAFRTTFTSARAPAT
jgi:hypothetical protein